MANVVPQLDSRDLEGVDMLPIPSDMANEPVDEDE